MPEQLLQYSNVQSQDCADWIVPVENPHVHGSSLSVGGDDDIASKSPKRGKAMMGKPSSCMHRPGDPLSSTL
ncbi:unnamed protein product [Fusarium graminearum]|uniref:Chromosome 4, complete genome n=1 Tax=Gibberella zeae (strain ATCC MYA-4620 / CBS 123657 / FGSC 9075 / NRRL 31084 / PH-1) TaxID=229533 RepID=A0A098DTM5_GIBZE|nr:unnamed protein product [Fusarium graminearum]CZS72281.1 unnamed protein product [Fusarium graminearum]